MLMKSKIHRASITDAHLDYEGSITIDRALLDAADVIENEKVQVVNINNGERFETYVIEGEPGSGVIALNGAAARRGQPGDKVIIISYASFDENEAETHVPTVIKVDDRNAIAGALYETGAHR